MENQLTILISTIAAAISAVFAAVSSIMTYSQYRKERLQKLNDRLDKILEIGIQYPYVENANFISRWVEMKDSQDEQYLRYDMYCNLLFNYLVAVYDYYNADKNKIEKFVDVKSWVRLHQLNWKYPVDPNENIDGYSLEFRNFINSYI